MKVYVTHKKHRHTTEPGTGGNIRITEVVPGRTLTLNVHWAHLRDGCLVYRSINDPEGTEQLLSMSEIFALTITGRGELPGPPEGKGAVTKPPTAVAQALLTTQHPAQ